jgi:hypothetical protein
VEEVAFLLLMVLHCLVVLRLVVPIQGLLLLGILLQVDPLCYASLSVVRLGQQ